MEDWGGFVDQFVGEMRGVFREHNKGAESVKASLLVRLACAHLSWTHRVDALVEVAEYRPSAEPSPPVLLLPYQRVRVSPVVETQEADRVR